MDLHVAFALALDTLAAVTVDDSSVLSVFESARGLRFYLWVKPPHGSFQTMPPMVTPPASYIQQLKTLHAQHLQESYMIHLLQTWARPNDVDVVLLVPSSPKHPLSPQQRHQLTWLGVKLQEVPWIRPELGRGIPRWAQENWCVDRDFFKLHALGLDYEAVIFYDSDAGRWDCWDVFVDPPNFEPLEEPIAPESLQSVLALFQCAFQGYFLASALHGGFEALTVAFFALRPAPALLRAVQRFLQQAVFDEDVAWNAMGFGPWGCLDATDDWCFHCYHVGGECGQGLLYNLFYQADPVFWSALAAEPGAVRPMGVMLDGCRWLYENSEKEVVAYHKVIKGRGCAAQPLSKRLKLVPSDEDMSLFVISSVPAYVVTAEKRARESAQREGEEEKRRLNVADAAGVILRW
eukprot:Skav228074  [mRNA]  locus=scaffold5285:23057:29933:- [translate_table: standard]